MVRLGYGNTNTFFFQGGNGGLIFDTDYAGTLHAFYRTIKQEPAALQDYAAGFSVSYEVHAVKHSNDLFSASIF